jgi:hypothetical protein
MSAKTDFHSLVSKLERVDYLPCSDGRKGAGSRLSARRRWWEAWSDLWIYAEVGEIVEEYKRATLVLRAAES